MHMRLIDIREQLFDDNEGGMFCVFSSGGVLH